MTSPASQRPLISVVVPTLNESGNIERLYDRLVKVFDDELHAFDWELVITDNRSTDNTFELICNLAENDQRVRGYQFSKNFGYQRSILAGYLLTTGDAVVQLDADMQDPPELVPELVDEWQSGAQVVYGVRKSRKGESAVLTGSRKVFYRLVDWLSDEELPRDAGDFRLVDRTVVDLLRHTHDANPYLRGAIAAMGFEQVGVEYERDDRTAGDTKFRLGSLVRLAVDGILNHSTRPLQLASLTAMVVIAISVAAMFSYVGARLFFGEEWPAGFVTLALLQLVAIILNAAFLGIIGAYLGRMFTQMRAAPIVVIDSSSRADHARSLFTAASPVTFEAIRSTPTEGSEDD